MEMECCVYIITNPRNTVLYIGVTSNLSRRVWEHKQKLVPGFTSKYNCTKLVYVEVMTDINEAIAREKELKDWNRNKKIDLVNSLNPDWKDMGDEMA